MDSLRAYLIEMIPLIALEINQSRINSAKSSGKLSLLTSEDNAAITIYETSLLNYKEAEDFQKSYFKNYLPILLNFSIVEFDHKQFFPDMVYPKHPDYILSDQDLLSFLRTKRPMKNLTLFC